MDNSIHALLTVAETARLLDRSTEQVRRYLREGSLPGERLGGQWFITAFDVDQFLAHRRETDTVANRLAASDADPLAAVIGIGGSGGADIAAGSVRYLRLLRINQ